MLAHDLELSSRGRHGDSLGAICDQSAGHHAAAAIVTLGRDPADYDDDVLDRLADRITDRLAVRLGGLTPAHAQPEDGWTLAMAQRELAVVLRDVDLGTWRPPRPDPAPTKNANPTFHEFASDWFAAKRLEIEKNTASSYGNDLTNHLLPFFKDHRISEITVAEVDMLPLLREIPTEHKAASERAGPDDPVFVTSASKPRSRHNIRQDVVDAVVAHANRLVEERGLQPLPLGITPHKLRHTFASILVAIGKPR